MRHDPTLVPASVVDESWMTLLGAIEQLPGTSTVAEIMSIVCCGARELSGADGVTFVLRDGELCYYADEDAVGPLWKGKRFPMSACISGWCMLRRETVVIPDIYVDARVPQDAYRPTFVKSLVMVPVRLEMSMAAIGTYWKTEQHPAAHTVRMLEALAQSCASAIDYAQKLEARKAKP